MQGDGHSPAPDREKIPPEVLAAVTLDDIAVAITELLALTQRQIPKGQTPFMPLTVTTTLRELSLTPPWLSVKIINDGPETVFVNVNDPDGNAIPINNGDVIDLDFGWPVVRLLFFVTETDTAALRLIGLY